MTFKDELEKILRDLHGYEVPLTGEVTLDADLDYQNKLVTREIDQALTSIINLVDKELPDKKNDNIAQSLRAGTYERGDHERVSGYNQAIDDIRAIIRGEKTS